MFAFSRWFQPISLIFGFSVHRLFLSLIFCYALSSAKGNDHSLVLVREPSAPIFKNDKTNNKIIMYSLEFLFAKHAPLDYWIVYNAKMKKLILDIYGSHIIGKPKIDLSGRGVFKNIEIVNTKTKLSLSGKRSNILIEIEEDDEWHFKAITSKKRKILITAWKDISALSDISNKNKGTKKKMKPPKKKKKAN